MKNKSVVVGDVLGIYQVLDTNMGKYKDGHKLYRVKCLYCGMEFTKQLSDIKRASSCQHVRAMGVKAYKHIEDKRIWSIHKGMFSRCDNPKDKSYPYYGGKGITVCEEWRDSSAFTQWALQNGYQASLTIDRIDPKGNYCPKNCRWISKEENSRYNSNTNRITVEGTTKCGKEWARFLMLGENYINRYLRKNGMDKTVEYIKQRQSILVQSIEP